LSKEKVQMTKKHEKLLTIPGHKEKILLHSSYNSYHEEHQMLVRMWGEKKP
jgi:hypothetical protein